MQEVLIEDEGSSKLRTRYSTSKSSAVPKGLGQRLKKCSVTSGQSSGAFRALSSPRSGTSPAEQGTHIARLSALAAWPGWACGKSRGLRCAVAREALLLMRSRKTQHVPQTAIRLQETWLGGAPVINSQRTTPMEYTSVLFEHRMPSICSGLDCSREPRTQNSFWCNCSAPRIKPLLSSYMAMPRCPWQGNAAGQSNGNKSELGLVPRSS
jgi:hypothetical protein